MRIQLVLLTALVLGFNARHAPAAEREVRLAATASVADSGLIESLLPEFAKESGLRVRVIAVPSATALRMATEGRVDVVLTDSLAGETALLQSHVLLARQPLMEDYTLIVGPAEDPAQARETASGADAFRRIAAAHAAYVMREDDSAEHERELALFQAAGLDAKTAWPEVVRTKAGLAQVLLEAGQKKAYALSDLSTFLLFQKRTGLVRLSKADDDLRNVYALSTVNPEKHPGKLDAEAANRLVEWFLRASTSLRIAEYGQNKFDEPLYRPLNLEND